MPVLGRDGGKEDVGEADDEDRGGEYQTYVEIMIDEVG